MKFSVLIFVVAFALVKLQANDDHIRHQGKQNTQHAQDISSAPAPSQAATNPTNQKPAGDASQNENKPVSITSIPKITVQPDEDWIMVGCTIVLTIVGIIGTCAAIMTLRHIRRQADTLDEHKSKFEELAQAAQANALAAQDTARAAKNNAQAVMNASRSRIVIKSNPYIGARVKDGSLGYNYEFLAKNVGTAPAEITAISFQRIVLGPSQTLPVEPEYELIAWPDRDWIFTDRESRDKLGTCGLGDGEWEKLSASGSISIVIGKVVYQDDVSGQHETRFCYRYAKAPHQESIGIERFGAYAYNART